MTHPMISDRAGADRDNYYTASQPDDTIGCECGKDPCVCDAPKCECCNDRDWELCVECGSCGGCCECDEPEKYDGVPADCGGHTP
jgi:hypothetical protein